MPSRKVSSGGEVARVVLPFEDEGSLLGGAEEEGRVLPLQSCRDAPALGIEPCVHHQDGEVGELFPVQPVQMAQGLLQTLPVSLGADHSEQRRFLGRGEQTGEEETMQAQQQRAAQKRK